MRESFSRSSLIDLATELADRLSDGEKLSDRSSTSIADTGRGLAQDAGIAIFFAAMLQVHEKASYRSALHAHMKAAAHSREPESGGLFVGVHGLLTACRYVMCVEPRYGSLVEQCSLVAKRLDPETTAWECADSFTRFDIISGMAGRAIALAWAVSPHLARTSCDYLVWLLEDANRWRCFHPHMHERGAMHDIGMAHGLAGMVAALAIGAPREERYEYAVRRGMEQLCAFRVAPEAKGWPGIVESVGPAYGQAAWCYGTPGCAAALLRASERCGDAGAAAIARESLLNLAKLDDGIWTKSEHALCHGNAGNAMVYGLAAQYFKDKELLKCRDRIIERIIDGFEPKYRFGYRASTEHGFVDKANLLSGAAGIGLALVTLAGACDPSWVALFGMPSLTRMNNG